MTHPIHAKDADTGCRWLCLNAGIMTKRDEAELAEALRNLPFQGQPLPVSLFPERIINGKY